MKNINILLILYFIIYEIPVSTFNNFRNRKRDKYLMNILDEKFKDLEKCLLLCQYFKCNDKKLCKIIEIVNFNNIEYKLIEFKTGARINTEGLCFWRGNVKKHVVMAGTHDLNGGLNRNFVI
jgi:hypothetical protein